MKMEVVRKVEVQEEVRPYTASLQNTEGDGFLYYVSLPHSPAPVLHKHRGLSPASIRTLQQQRVARQQSRTSHGEFESGVKRVRNTEADTFRPVVCSSGQKLNLLIVCFHCATVTT